MLLQALIAIFLLCYNAVSRSTEFCLNDFVLVQEGNLPILLTAPHGGNKQIEHIQARKSGNTIPDIKTLELAELVSSNLTILLGRKPYIVAAKFSRTYLDANRAEKRAYDQENCPLLQTLYRSYHHHITNFVQALKNKYPKGAILLDLHGQIVDKQAIYIGTGNGLTIATMKLQHGEQAMVGPHSIVGQLRKRGYVVLPDNTQNNQAEELHYIGGYTVRTHGSHNNGIDAIQLEIGFDLRYTQEKIIQFAKDLAESIAHFCHYYLEN